MTSRTETRTVHPYHMYDAIRSQPEAIARVLSGEADSVRELAQAAQSASRLHVVGIGTSWHAALVGEWLLRVVAGRQEARAWNSYEFWAYPPPLGPDDLVVVMSHRGTKRYSLYALESARNSGAVTALVTAIGSSARVDLADFVVRTSPEEASSAFTVSHTSAMTALAMLAAEMGARADRALAHDLQHGLQHLPQLVERALAHEAAVQEWVQHARTARKYYFAGWGPNAASAYEVALKVKETSYRMTEGFQIEQYLHGPYVATDPDDMVTFIVPPGVGRERTVDLISATRTVGAHAVVVVEEDDYQISGMADTAVPAPATAEPLTPIVYLVPLQMFTYWLAVQSGRNPDTFRLDDSAHRAARDKYEL